MPGRRDYAKHVLKPFGIDFPGLAKGGGDRTDDDAAAATFTDDPAQLSAVLRSWEDRFDTVVVGMSIDTLHVAARRPATGDDALLVAAEQKAFCPDIVDQGTGTIGALASELEGSPAWYFWWD